MPLLPRRQVTVAPEDSGTADALRSVAHKIVADTFVVMSGDLVTDAPLQAVVTSHNVRGARATMVVTPRKTSPCMETKPGKAPKVR